MSKFLILLFVSCSGSFAWSSIGGRQLELHISSVPVEARGSLLRAALLGVDSLGEDDRNHLSVTAVTDGTRTVDVAGDTASPIQFRELGPGATPDEVWSEDAWRRAIASGLIVGSLGLNSTVADSWHENFASEAVKIFDEAPRVTPERNLLTGRVVEDSLLAALDGRGPSALRLYHRVFLAMNPGAYFIERNVRDTLFSGIAVTFDEERVLTVLIGTLAALYTRGPLAHIDYEQAATQIKDLIEEVTLGTLAPVLHRLTLSRPFVLAEEGRGSTIPFQRFAARIGKTARAYVDQISVPVSHRNLALSRALHLNLKGEFERSAYVRELLHGCAGRLDGQ